MSPLWALLLWPWAPCGGGTRDTRATGSPWPSPPPSPQLDGLIHRFITLLADTSDSRSSENRVADANMACRKLAVAHPILLLRYGRPRVSYPPQPGRPSGGSSRPACTPVLIEERDLWHAGQ